MTAGWLLRRLGTIVLVLLIVSFTVFGITQLLPGNAAVMILGEFATADQRHAMELAMGLNDPWYQQYGHWLGNILRGDWGMSAGLSRPVASLVGDALGRSAILAGATLVTVCLVATPIGVAGALLRGTVFDLVIGLVAYLGASVPEFVTATLLLVVVAGPDTGWLPAGGFTPAADGLGQFALHMVLPVATLSLILVAHLSRQIRSEMGEVLGSDYIRAAQVKGLTRTRIVLVHALRNALAPAVAVLSLDVGYLLGGILVVEEVFAWPGLGRLLIYAVQNRDLVVMQAATLVMAAAYTMSNLAADIIIAKLDPRVHYA
ncbi:ABC transporter permease [Acidisphaera sp. L21]|uniref:ABC transporter permease n=1 Tax=Acidisphaera sp. L21 TaxID=1641851 RepID=UPI00131BB4BA|nr:ABC transporter permease [Acidisphaera sp. L21]